MPKYQMQAPDGKTYEIEANDLNAAIEALSGFAAVTPGKTLGAPPPAPPGAIIHGAERSYMADQPDVGVARPQGIGTSEADRQNAIAMEALKWRGQTGGMGETGRALMPVGQGVGTPWIDEAVAAMSSGAVSGDGFDLAMEKQRQELDRERTEHPTRSMLGQIAGGVAAGPLLGRAASPLLSRLPALGAAPTGAALGAATGAAMGYGEGQGDERATNALYGGAVGGAVGAAAPIIGGGIQRGYQAARDFLMRRQQLAGLNISPDTAQVMQQVLAGDDVLGAGGQANIRAAGPNGMLADAGPGVRTMLDTAIAKSGDPRITQASRAIEERATAATGQMNQALDAALGPAQGVNTSETAIRLGSAPARRATYDAAYNSPIDYASPEGRQIEEFLRRVPQEAINNANRLMRVEGAQSQQIMAQIAPDGTVTYQQMPDVRQLDYITRGLNHTAALENGAGALGGTTDIGRAITNLSHDMRGTLRQAVPEYATALETAADPIRRRQALQLGADLLRPSTMRDVAAEEIAGMTGPERAALRSGIRAHIDEVMANVSRTVSDGNVDAREGIKALKDLSSRAAREKIEMAVGPQEAQALFSQIDEAARAFDLRAGVATNSRTFARTATDEAVKRTTEPGPVGLFLEGKMPSVAMRVIQMLSGRTPDALNARHAARYGEIAELLTGPRGQAALDAAQALNNAATARAASQQTAAQLGTDAGGAISGGLYNAIVQMLSAQPQKQR